MCRNFPSLSQVLLYIELGKTTNNGNTVEVNNMILDDAAALFKQKQTAVKNQMATNVKWQTQEQLGWQWGGHWIFGQWRQQFSRLYEQIFWFASWKC